MAYEILIDWDNDLDEEYLYWQQELNEAKADKLDNYVSKVRAALKLIAAKIAEQDG